jgi:hypothetical protein
MREASFLANWELKFLANVRSDRDRTGRAGRRSSTDHGLRAASHHHRRWITERRPSVPARISAAATPPPGVPSSSALGEHGPRGARGCPAGGRRGCGGHASEVRIVRWSCCACVCVRSNESGGGGSWVLGIDLSRTVLLLLQF